MATALMAMRDRQEGTEKGERRRDFLCFCVCVRVCVAFSARNETEWRKERHRHRERERERERKRGFISVVSFCASLWKLQEYPSMSLISLLCPTIWKLQELPLHVFDSLLCPNMHPRLVGKVLMYSSIGKAFPNGDQVAMGSTPLHSIVASSEIRDIYGVSN